MKNIEKKLIPGKIYIKSGFGEIPFIEEKGDILRFAEIGGEGYYDVLDTKKSEVEISNNEIKFGYTKSYVVSNDPKSPYYDPKKYSKITKVMDIIRNKK